MPKFTKSRQRYFRIKNLTKVIYTRLDGWYLLLRNVFSHEIMEIEDPNSNENFKVNRQYPKPFLELQANDEENVIVHYEPQYLE